MFLDLKDPSSILAWWSVWPARHNEYLDGLLASRPQFAGAIKQAKREIASNTDLQLQLAESVREMREQAARQSVREKSSMELRWQELATAV